MLLGYARIALPTESLNAQFETLRAAGCVRIFSDDDPAVPSPSQRRPGLRQALACLTQGDELAVVSLDRLGHTARRLIQLMADLHRQGIGFRSLAEEAQAPVAFQSCFFQVMTALDRMQKRLDSEHTQAGRTAVRRPGRHRQMTEARIAQAQTLLRQGLSAQAVARQLGVSRATLYRWLPGGQSALSNFPDTPDTPEAPDHCDN